MQSGRSTSAGPASMKRATGTWTDADELVAALAASTRQTTQSAGCTRAQLELLCASM
jgi:hypothetical protein